MNDPRGKVRTIVKVEEKTDGTMITTDCGHCYARNQTFHYEVGNKIHCFECKDKS